MIEFPQIGLARFSCVTFWTKSDENLRSNRVNDFIAVFLRLETIFFKKRANSLATCYFSKVVALHLNHLFFCFFNLWCRYVNFLELTSVEICDFLIRTYVFSTCVITFSYGQVDSKNLPQI